MSKEHMWPNWLKEYVPRKITSWGQQSVTFHRKGVVEAKVRPRTGDPHASKLRVVCQKCNGGWMSRLQEATKPILVPLLQGRGGTLYRRDQQLLARWIAMFVMTNEFSSSDQTKIAIPTAERRFLMERETVPANWRIWIGHYERGLTEGLWAHHSIPISDDNHVVQMTDDNRPIANTQATTFIVGQLYVTVLSSAITQTVRRWHFGERGEQFLRQIWPIKNAIVRLPESMTTEDASTFAGAFFFAGTRVKVPFGTLFPASPESRPSKSSE